MRSSSPLPLMMVSLPWPPMTMLRPSPALMMSLPPPSAFCVKTEVYVKVVGAVGIGSDSGMSPMIVPKSPKMRSSLGPLVMLSPPAPPMTMFEPAPVSVIESGEPSVGLIGTIAVNS